MSSDKNVDRWATELGAVAFLSKPFGMAQLLSTIEVLIEREVPGPGT
jgi:DNA-binding response OmpR family regulator